MVSRPFGELVIVGFSLRFTADQLLVVANRLKGLVLVSVSFQQFTRGVDVRTEIRGALGFDSSGSPEYRKKHETKQQSPHQEMRHDIAERGSGNPSPLVVVGGVGFADHDFSRSTFKEDDVSGWVGFVDQRRSHSPMFRINQSIIQ